MIDATPKLTEEIEEEIFAIEEAINVLEMLSNCFSSGGWKPSSLNQVEIELLDRKDDLEQLLEALAPVDKTRAA